MAQKIVYEVDIKTKSAEKSVDNLNESIKKTNKSQSDLSASTGILDKATGGLTSKLGASLGTLKNVTMGFKTLRGAIISTGIGALVVAVGSLIAAFQSSEEGQNKFAKLMSVIGAVTGNFVDLLADLGEKIIWAFENPRQAVNDFVKLLRENIINRFEGLLELVPKLGQSIQLLFKGEFSEAGKVAANAVGKVVLGVEDITTKVQQATQAVVEFTKEQIAEGKAAAEVADMRAKADKIERQLLIDRSKLESEIAQLRLKARQEDQFSAEERKNALLEAQALEDQLLDKETEFLTLRRDAQILENTFSRTNKENLDKEAQAVAAVNNQVAARANVARTLQRELNTINNQIESDNKARLEEEKKAEKEKNDFILAQRDALAIDLDSKAQLEILKTQEKYDALIEQAKKYGGDVTALEQARADSVAKIEDALNAEKKKIADEDLKREQALQDQKQQIITQAIGNLIGVVGANSKFGKGIAIVQAIRDTFAGANKALASAPPPFNFIQAAAVVAGGLANVKNITSTKEPQAPAIPGARSFSVGSVSGSVPSPPQINTIGASGISQLAQTIQGQAEKPIKAYVVSGDVTTAQALDRNIVREAGI